MLVQVAAAWQLWELIAHSSMSTHATPLPLKPALQAQVKPPAVLAQVASAAQLSGQLLAGVAAAAVVGAVRDSSISHRLLANIRDQVSS